MGGEQLPRASKYQSKSRKLFIASESKLFIASESKSLFSCPGLVP
jgi:hypothetical protein